MDLRLSFSGINYPICFIGFIQDKQTNKSNNRSSIRRAMSRWILKKLFAGASRRLTWANRDGSEDNILRTTGFCCTIISGCCSKCSMKSVVPGLWNIPKRSVAEFEKERESTCRWTSCRTDTEVRGRVSADRMHRRNIVDVLMLIFLFYSALLRVRENSFHVAWSQVSVGLRTKYNCPRHNA